MAITVNNTTYTERKARLVSTVWMLLSVLVFVLATYACSRETLSGLATALLLGFVYVLCFSKHRYYSSMADFIRLKEERDNG